MSPGWPQVCVGRGIIETVPTSVEPGRRFLSCRRLCVVFSPGEPWPFPAEREHGRASRDAHSHTPTRTPPLTQHTRMLSSPKHPHTQVLHKAYHTSWVIANKSYGITSCGITKENHASWVRSVHVLNVIFPVKILCPVPCSLLKTTTYIYFF